ncbi:hypothetical protein CCHL11_07680 [Colletotrichum chlorophyti]|uniref:Ricin B lectin domain-containing protein n=1 Tax=Colletotrichum chlorophyti TaxID=708187 RepID=A0A1Q8RCK8_9PEZI|nr:hypothetical protein CCHL11_07680 [Colletotrichum chlorophyti]
MAELDPNVWYRLSKTRVNNGTGPFVLNFQPRDVGFRVHSTSESSAAWQFQPVGGIKGRYHIRLDQAGVKQQLGVCYDADEYASRSTVACMQDSSSIADSQIWEVSIWDGPPGGYKLVNIANGSDYALDVHPLGTLFMNKVEDLMSGTEQQLAQHWDITSIGTVDDGAYSTVFSGSVANSTSAAPTPTAVSITTRVTAIASRYLPIIAARQTAASTSASQSDQPTSTAAPSNPITPAAGAGIGVAVAVSVVGLIGAIAFFWWRRKQSGSTKYSEVEHKNGGGLDGASSSMGGSPAIAKHAMYDSAYATSNYAAPLEGSPAALNYTIPVAGPSHNYPGSVEGYPAGTQYPGYPASTNYPAYGGWPSSTADNSSLSSWNQPSSTSGLIIPPAVNRHQFDHPAIQNEFAPGASNRSFESTTRFGFGSLASSQHNSTTNLHAPEPVPSAHELQVAVSDVPRRQHELGEFHHGPETLQTTPDVIPLADTQAELGAYQHGPDTFAGNHEAKALGTPKAELGAYQHGPDTFADEHEAKALGAPKAELGAYHHGPDTFADEHEDKMLGTFQPEPKSYQAERDEKVLGNFRDLMGQRGPNGRSGRQNDADEWQSYEMESFRSQRR